MNILHRGLQESRGGGTNRILGARQVMLGFGVEPRSHPALSSAHMPAACVAAAPWTPEQPAAPWLTHSAMHIGGGWGAGPGVGAGPGPGLGPGPATTAAAGDSSRGHAAVAKAWASETLRGLLRRDA